MIAFFKFISSPRGRLIQALTGIALILLGLIVIDTALGDALLVLGMVPLTAGVFDLCIPAPFFGLPFLGPKLRTELHRRRLHPQMRPH